MCNIAVCWSRKTHEDFVKCAYYFSAVVFSTIPQLLCILLSFAPSVTRHNSSTSPAHFSANIYFIVSFCWLCSLSLYLLSFCNFGICRNHLIYWNLFQPAISANSISAIKQQQIKDRWYISWNNIANTSAYTKILSTATPTLPIITVWLCFILVLYLLCSISTYFAHSMPTERILLRRHIYFISLVILLSFVQSQN